jgi:hypothetical protein
MADYYNLVPGYVVRPERYGPDVFLNVGGQSWTDMHIIAEAAPLIGCH